jgi:hypothetical protein
MLARDAMQSLFAVAVPLLLVHVPATAVIATSRSTDRLGKNEENGTGERAVRAREFSEPPEPA